MPDRTTCMPTTRNISQSSQAKSKCPDKDCIFFKMLQCRAGPARQSMPVANGVLCLICVFYSIVHDFPGLVH